MPAAHAEQTAPAAHSSSDSAARSQTDSHRQYRYIDALRGYAVLLVITCHTGGMFAGLPYPLKKLTNFGWHGVQLFFLMSCVTLLMSWRSDEAKGRASALAFWLRRVFRIAPMYYLAAPFYFAIETPPSGFDPHQLLATLLFVNAWHPLLIPTVPDRWMVVPGGWSIGVEVTFYLVFPLVAVLVRSMRAALVFSALAIIGGGIANQLAGPVLAAEYGAAASRNFIYFWFPNQVAVFALGTILYFLLRDIRDRPGAAPARLLRRHATGIVLGCAAACVIAANLPLPGQLPLAPPLVVPTFLVASVIFMVLALALASEPRPRFVNRLICSFGKVSFSAYLLHFAVLHKLPVLLPGVFDIKADGVRAILVCGALWVSVIPITYGLSLVTFRSIEAPMIALGRRILRARQPTAPGPVIAPGQP